VSELKVSDWIAQFLAEQGVTHVYELIGGMITHMIDSIHEAGRIELVSVRHEQAAAFAADAAGRCTGIPGVAMATSGPGATNLITGIGSAHFDSSPAVFLTGQVNRHEQKGERDIRQLGFQETDIVAMVKPITKGAVRAESPEEVPGLLAWAFELAMEGRPGPVVVDLPMDVQGARIAESELLATVQVERNRPGDEVIEVVLEDLRRAERPLVLVGAGVQAAGAAEAVRSMAHRLGVPVVNSLLGVDVLPAGDPLRVGLIGSYGNRWANMGLGRADALLVLGARLDIRQTGADIEAFKGDRVIHHVDVHAPEINNRVPDCHPVVGDVGEFARAVLAHEASGGVGDFSPWVEELADLRRQWPDTEELNDVAGVNPNVLMHQISAASADAGAYVVDVGQHQQWAAQSLDLAAGQRFLTSGGMGAMGFSLPAAIGAAKALRRPIVVITGDGCFQLNIQELQTVVHHGLPLKIVVVDNKCHGMVRQFQETYFSERYASTWWGYSAPDFARVAAAYGIEGDRVDDPADVDDALARMWADPNAPFLLQVDVDSLANAYPKLAFGRPITEMEPLAQPVAMEGT
jgi:acetolactate synthase-1/2/3 large subunit